MSHTDLADCLRALPAKIHHAEIRLQQAEALRSRARAQLTAEEDCHLLSGHITGKNAPEREAQLRVLTRQARGAVDGAEEQYRADQLAVRHLQDQFSAARAIARLLASKEE